MAGLLSYISFFYIHLSFCMRELLNTVGHNMNGKHISIPKSLKDSGAWRWDSKKFLLRSVLLLTR